MNKDRGGEILKEFFEIYQNFTEHWSQEEIDSHFEVFRQGFLSGNRFTLKYTQGSEEINLSVNDNEK